MPRKELMRQALLDFRTLLKDSERIIDVILVEGPRDEHALRQLGFEGRLETLAKVGVSKADLMEHMTGDSKRVLILSDFDEEGRHINKRLSRLLEQKGIIVERSLRRAFRKLMATLGIYVIEALDNIEEKLQEREYGAV